MGHILRSGREERMGSYALEASTTKRDKTSEMIYENCT